MRLKIIFLVFAVFEIVSGILNMTADSETLRELVGTAETLEPAEMLYPMAFGNALIAIGLASLLAFFLTERRSLVGLSVVFAVFNAGAAWLCLTLPLPDVFTSGGYTHVGFSVVFLLMGIIFLRRSPG